MAPGVAGLFVLAGLAACGSDTDSAPADTAAIVTDSVTTEPAVSEPVSTEADATEPVATEATAESDETQTETTLVATDEADDTDPIDTEDAASAESDTEADATDAPVTSIEFTPELQTFANENATLLQDWTAQLTTFGTEAIDNLGDVSAAPSAPRLLELSDEVVDAIGADTTDVGLVVARDFASGVSMAINQSMDGDQEGALSTFFALQEKAEGLTATLDQFGN